MIDWFGPGTIAGLVASSSSSSGWVTLCIVVGLYFLPWIVAWQRHVPHVGSVAVINVFLG